MNPFRWTLASAIALTVPAYCALTLTGTPSLLAPFPTLTILVAFALPAAFPWLAAVVPSVLFVAWNPALFRGEARVPQRSLALLMLLTVLTIVDFIIEWRDGVVYQGARFTYGVCAANVIWLVVLWIAFVRGFRRSSFFNNLLAHWLLFAWLASFAFPYLGELP